MFQDPETQKQMIIHQLEQRHEPSLWMRYGKKILLWLFARSQLSIENIHLRLEEECRGNLACGIIADALETRPPQVSLSGSQNSFGFAKVRMNS
jgi:hypothetical protein